MAAKKNKNRTSPPESRRNVRRSM